jgi:hypothetical protein
MRRASRLPARSKGRLMAIPPFTVPTGGYAARTRIEAGSPALADWPVIIVTGPMKRAAGQYTKSRGAGSQNLFTLDLN